MRENKLGNIKIICNEKEVRANYEKLTKQLIEKNLSITTMESATSGIVASLITDTEGSSQIFKGAYVAYCNEMKIKLGVPDDVIREYSVYSEETARAMATASRNTFGADIAIGITGTMGNLDPENIEASTLGKVYFAISINDGMVSFTKELLPQPNRYLYKLALADKVYNELIKLM